MAGCGRLALRPGPGGHAGKSGRGRRRQGWLFWWDHMLTLLGTGLRFGELAGLRRRRVHLDRPSRCSRSVPPATRPAGLAVASSPGPRATPASAKCPWPRRSSRPSTASSHPAATPTTWCSPALVAALASATGPVCAEGQEQCCPGTTSTAPTKPPWPSWPTRPSRCAPQHGACCEPSVTAGPGRRPARHPPDRARLPPHPSDHGHGRSAGAERRRPGYRR
jgi:hypothetical protein